MSATHTTLREQVARAIEAEVGYAPGRFNCNRAADAVLVVFAERERLLRERIEALPAKRWGFATAPGECGWVRVEDVLAAFDNG